jgi:MFS transporter, DHA1 family, inner membrane transport protein
VHQTAMQEADEERRGVRRRELIVVLILAAVQFTTIVDFMIVMPLGPQLMRTLEIGPAEFGLIVSSYTYAAGGAGLVASAIVDRFARRTAFMALNAGFLLGTLFCGLAPTYEILVAARIATGAFGGILGGMAMAIIGDVFPEERRGRATGALMTGFSLASVAGVPLGLYLGTNHGWHVPFVVLAIGGLPALLLTWLALPRLDAHVGKQHAHPLRSVTETFAHANHLNAFALIVALMIGSFTVFPYLSAYLVSNVGMTEQELPLVYIAGGALTLVAAPIVGRLADRHGKLRMFRLIAPASAVMMVVITHLPAIPVAAAVAVFGTLMVCNVGRMIPAMAMVTSSVEPRRRGAFLSANSSVQHIASGVGANLGGLIAAVTTLASLWLAGRVRMAEVAPAASAEDLSMAAAAEASVDAGEPMVGVG